MGFFGNGKELQFEARNPRQTTGKTREQTRGTFFYRGEAPAHPTGCYKQRAHWRKLGVGSVVAFHWLSCDSLSLAGLLPGREKSFLPLLGRKVVTFFLLEMPGTLFLLGLQLTLNRP